MQDNLLLRKSGIHHTLKKYLLFIHFLFCQFFSSFFCLSVFSPHTFLHLWGAPSKSPCLINSLGLSVAFPQEEMQQVTRCQNDPEILHRTVLDGSLIFHCWSCHFSECYQLSPLSGQFLWLDGCRTLASVLLSTSVTVSVQQSLTQIKWRVKEDRKRKIYFLAASIFFSSSIPSLSKVGIWRKKNS